MFKKLSITFLFLLTLALALVSCEIPNLQIPQIQTPHTHTYGEWETIKEATFTTEGIKVRYCLCGEMQEASIPTKEKTEMTLNEWKEAFNLDKYQTFTLEVAESRITTLDTESNYDRTILAKYSHPYMYGETRGEYIYGTEVGAIYYAGGIEIIESMSDFLTELIYAISLYEDFGFSKFIYDEASGKYKSLILTDMFDSVYISFSGNLIESIQIEKDYWNSYYGDTTEDFLLTISNINKTEISDYDLQEAHNLYKNSISNISLARYAARFNQSSTVYDLDESKSAITNLLNSLNYLSNKNIKVYHNAKLISENEEYDTERYNYLEIEYKNYGSFRIFDNLIYYDTIEIAISDGKIIEVSMMSNSNFTFNIYFGY